MEKKEMYGYVRVSTKEQNEDRQVLALQECSIPLRNIYTYPTFTENLLLPQPSPLGKWRSPASSCLACWESSLVPLSLTVRTHPV